MVSFSKVKLLKLRVCSPPNGGNVMFDMEELNTIVEL